jgi:hypothetical protein
MITRLGIVGSSYSNGSHTILNPALPDVGGTCKPTEYFYNKHCNAELYNFSLPGRGSEEYYKSIIKAHDVGVDTIVLEMCTDRTNSIVRMPKDHLIYNDCLNIADTKSLEDITTDINKLRQLTQSTSAYRSPLKSDLQWKPTIPGTHTILMPYIKFKILEDAHSVWFWTFEKIYFAIKLAKKLRINVCLWEHHDIPACPLKDTVINYAESYVKIPKGAGKYFNEKYGNQSNCDGDHLSDMAQEELIRDFIIPELKNQKWVL